MSIILHHTLRSIRDHIYQTAIVVFTIIVVTALFFAAFALKDMFYCFHLMSLSRMAGDADVAIEGGFFSDAKLEEFCAGREDRIECVDKFLVAPGIASSAEAKEKSLNVSVEATDLATFAKRHADRLFRAEGMAGAKCDCPEAWLGKALAKKLGLKPGDPIEIYIGMHNRRQLFTVRHIFEDKGYFSGGVEYSVLTDCKGFGNKGLFSNAYIRLKDKKDKDAIVSELRTHMGDPTLKIGDAIDREYIDFVVRDNENLLKIAIAFISGQVAFILCSAYDLVIKRRIREMLVFKSVGASPARLFFILLCEPLLYGAIGGAFGVVFGRCGMEITALSVIPEFARVMRYSALNYLVPLAAGILISALSSVAPILCLVRRAAKSARKARSAAALNVVGLCASLASVAVFAVCILFVPSRIQLFAALLIAAAIAFVIFCSPYVLNLASIAFRLGRGGARLASSAVKRNFEAANISRILGVVISFTFVTVSLIDVILDASAPIYSRFRADYAVGATSSAADLDEICAELRETRGAESAALFRHKKFDIEFRKKTDIVAFGVDSADDLDFVAKLTDAQKDDFNNVPGAAVVSYDLMNRYGRKLGDVLKIPLDGVEREFKAVAIAEARTADDRVFFVKRSNSDIPFDSANILLNVRDDAVPKDFFRDLKARLEPKGCYIVPFDDFVSTGGLGVSQLSLLLRILQALVGVVGLFGVVNMSASMLLGRRREYLIYGSVGLCRANAFALAACEGAQISLTGMLAGLGVSFALSFLIPDFARLIDRYVCRAFPLSALFVGLSFMLSFFLAYLVIGYRLERRAVAQTQPAFREGFARNV